MNVLKRWSNKITAAVGLVLLLTPLSASAVIQSPMQSGAAQTSFACPDQSFMPLVPAVSSADSSFYFNELTCRNNPMEGTDPYGLMTRHYSDDGNTCLMTGSYGDRLLFQKIRGEWVLLKEDIGELDTGFFNAGYAEGMQGGASIVANTVSFGGSDNLGWTESAQYQGTEFEISRGLAYGSRDLAMTAVGMGVVSKASKTATVANFVARNATAVNKVRTVAAVVGSFGTGVEVGTAGYAFYEGDYQTGIRSSMRVGSDLALTMFVKPKPAAKTPDIRTGAGYGAGDPPVRIEGEWSVNDMKQGLLGKSPRGLGKPDIHHGGQMPGAAKHEIIPGQHRNNPALHPNPRSQGVTPAMRQSDRELHWWYRAREQGADKILPDWIYDD